MPKWLVVLLFIAGTALTWGIYVPSIHVAATALKSNLRAFLLVGVAYFLTAVLVPLCLAVATWSAHVALRVREPASGWRRHPDEAVAGERLAGELPVVARPQEGGVAG